MAGLVCEKLGDCFDVSTAMIASARSSCRSQISLPAGPEPSSLPVREMDSSLVLNARDNRKMPLSLRIFLPSSETLRSSILLI